MTAIARLTSDIREAPERRLVARMGTGALTWATRPGERSLAIAPHRPT